MKAINVYPWLLVLALSIVLHLGFAKMMFMSSSQSTNAAKAEGKNGLQVGLGQLGAYETAVQKRAQKEISQRKEKARPINNDQPKERPKEKPQKLALDEPKKRIEKISQPKIDAKVSKNGVLKIENEKLIKKDIDIATVKQSKTEAPDRTGKQEPENEEKTNADNLGKNALRASGEANQKTFGGKKGSANAYFSLLKSWLNRHKTYPAHLKKAKKQGIVTVKFTIDKSGVLQKSSVKKKSGHSELDAAALKMLDDASPMPPIPKSFKRDQLTISLPISYSLRDE